MPLWLAVLGGLACALASPPARLSAQLSGPSRHRFSASGDFRLRGEFDGDRTGQSDRTRERLRLRVQGSYEALPSVTMTGRVVTQPNAADPNSSHQDLGQGFRDFRLAIDRAAVVWVPKVAVKVQLMAGKFGHPFAASPVFNELVWDADIQPEGAAVVLGPHRGVRLVAAEYLLLIRNPGKSVGLTAAQLSWTGTLAPGLSGSAGVGGYHYQRPDSGGARILARDNQGNALLVDAAGDTAGFASRFTVYHFFAGIRHDGWQLPIAASAQYVSNSRAAAGFDDDGLALGLEVGKLAKPGSWVAQYQYVEMGREALYSPVAQDDFLNSTNFRGHLAGVVVQLAPAVNCHLWALISAAEEPRVEKLQKRLRLDLNFKM